MAWMPLWILLGALAAPDAENPLLHTLVAEGVAMSDGSAVRLPEPTMPDGLDAAAQRAVLERIASSGQPVDELLRRSIVAPLVLKIAPAATERKAPARRVDLWFVAYGSWENVSSQRFLETLMRFGGRSAGAQGIASGFLADEAIQRRGLKAARSPEREEGWHFASANLLDRVQLQATRHTLITRRPDSLVIAAQIDPRFNKDPDYANTWSPVVRNLDDPTQVRVGPPRPYSAAGFYGKITRLAQPAQAVLVEYHVVFEEPKEWFGGVNLLGSKLPLVIQEEVRRFRRIVAAPAG